MAYPLIDLASIANALPTLIEDSVVAQMNRSAPELQLFGHKGATGKNLAWDVEFRNASESANSALAEGATVTVFGDDDIVPATLNYCDYSESISVTGKAMVGARQAAGAGGGASDLEDIWVHKTLNAIRRLGKNLGRDFWQGPGTGNRMLGLYGGSTLTSGAPLSNAGSYAGISRATYADWRANVLLNGGAQRPLSFDLMRDMRRAIYEACGEMPDLIMCDAAMHEAYGRLFNDQRRYITGDIALSGGRTVTLDGGYKALEFDGIPIVASVNHPANTLSFLNTHYISVSTPNDQVTRGNRADGFVNLQVMPEEQLKSGRTPFRARLNPLAVTGDTFPLQMILYPQIWVERCNVHGVLGDILA